MAKICYTPRKFGPDKARQIEIANSIISEYNAAGFDLTVRQLYYQFVARDYIANQPEEYGKLQGLLNDARLAGEIDWDAIVDRTRGLRANRHHAHPRDPIHAAADSFQFWKWENQPHYVEVWVEKDALSSIVASVCGPLDVAYFSCRGYTSVSEVHAAAMRFKYEVNKGKTVHIIHLGDHDPSGLDMTRDIKERINNVFRVPCQVHRVALNQNQIEKYSPPPNPAKMTDSRADKYVERHGSSSWELDALDPKVLAEIIKVNVLHWREEELYAAVASRERKARALLGAIYDRWNEVVRLMKRPPDEE